MVPGSEVACNSVSNLSFTLEPSWFGFDASEFQGGVRTAVYLAVDVFVIRILVNVGPLLIKSSARIPHKIGTDKT